MAGGLGSWDDRVNPNFPRVTILTTCVVDISVVDPVPFFTVSGSANSVLEKSYPDSGDRKIQDPDPI